MKQEARVVECRGPRVLVTIGDQGGPSAAACCSVSSVTMEVSNPSGWVLVPGERVEISDGLGAMIGAGLLVLILPVAFYGLGALLLGNPWAGVVAAIVGLALALVYFRSRRLGQYPLVSRRFATSAGVEDFDPSVPWAGP